METNRLDLEKQKRAGDVLGLRIYINQYISGNITKERLIDVLKRDASILEHGPVYDKYGNIR